MKKTRQAEALGLALSMVMGLAGCGAASQEAGSGSGEAPIELHVFAAASMQETLEQLEQQYESDHPSVEIVLNLDSSGTLKTQIQEGAECDLFIAASQLPMNQLDAASDETINPEGLDFVDESTRVDLLKNQVVLVVPEGNPKKIMSFDDIEKNADLISLGNEDVPVGQYSEEILTNLGVLDELEESGRITYGSNVKEVTTQVAEGLVDCGIVYETDAYSAGLEAVASADESLCSPAIYPAAVIKTSEHEDEAKAFLEYLQSEAAAEVFQSVGFEPLTAT